MRSIGILGINHKTAPLALREKMARAVTGLKNNRFFPYPTILLSTCNRTEIYYCAEDLAAAHSHLLSFLRSQVEEPFEQALYSFFGVDCFFHLCCVASGLDSAIFAEGEIQRQVRIAYSSSVEGLPACLHFVFQKALKVSKEVRSKQQQQGCFTLYQALWRLACWQNRKILLVGYSQINRGLLSFLMHKGIGHLTLATRRPDQVRLEGVQVTDRSLLSRWEEFDVIVCAAHADDYIIREGGHGSQVI
ncbi:MAG: glutamyl-tRNA reductase, partial [Verrucomicrobiota bacterium]|nr:glutamyl-tRNA reductase [Verrucomicrobiota bacterium]